MRITEFMIFQQATRNLGKAFESYGELNERLATGKKINKPSDDVTGIMRAMDYRVAITGADQYRRNIDEASSRLRFTDTIQSSASDTLANIRRLIAMSMSGTQDQTIRDGFALEAAGFRDHLADLANSTYRGQYLFGGYRTDIRPFTAGPAYLYQGDSGVMNVAIDRTAALAVNVTGEEAFAYTLAAAETKQISGGRFVHYTPGAGTTVDVEIRDTNDVTVLATFSFSNVLQMTDLLRAALGANDTLRIEALEDPFKKISIQVLTVQSDVGARLSRLNDQSDRLRANTVNMQNALSSVEDADLLQTATELKKVEVTLQSLRESASRVLSQSLLDFLR